MFLPGSRRRQARGELTRWIRRLGPGGAFGLVVLLAVVAAAAFGGAIAPQHPNRQNLADALLVPGASGMAGVRYLLGTDQLGRDITSRLLVAVRVSLAVAVVSVLVAAVVGSGAGMLVGYHGGMADGVLMRLVDIQLAFPFILLGIFIAATLAPSVWTIIFVATFASWARFARLVRGDVLLARERAYVEAARAIGCRPGRVVFGHIFPNVLAPIIVLVTLDLPRIIVLESTLSFLGLGIPPPTPSLGRMLSDAKDYLLSAWWLPVFPGLAISLIVLAVNLVGDRLRDLLDPRLRV